MTEHYHNFVRMKLNTLIDELNGKKRDGVQIADVSYEDNSFIMKFPNAKEIHPIIDRLLSNFKEARLINHDQFAQAQERWTANGDKCDLNFEYDARENSLNIIFKPKIEKDALYDHLDNAIQVARVGGTKEPAVLVKEQDSLIHPDLTIEKMGIINRLETLQTKNQHHGLMKSEFRGLQYSGNDEYIMIYSQTSSGKDEAIRLLKKIIAGGFLDKGDPKIDINNLKSGTKISFSNFDLETQTKDGLFQVIFKPKLSDDMVINNLERAINKTYAAQVPRKREEFESFVERMKLEPVDKAIKRTIDRNKSSLPKQI